jgi:magnesium transporter
LTRTAADEALPDVPRLPAEASAAATRRALRRGSYSSVTEIAVLAGNRLIGVVPVERVLTATDDATLGDLAAPTTVVAADADVEVATRAAARAGRRTVAVVDDRGRFIGLIPCERLLQVLEREHELDLARLGGFLSRASVARTASEEAVGRRLWHRLPWLALGLGGAMASAAIVGSFEEELQEEVLLAFFVPAVVYMADAVGTQTETVVIRAMSIGIPVRAMLVRELLTGLVIGTLVGLAFVPFAADLGRRSRRRDRRDLPHRQLRRRNARRDGASVRARAPRPRSCVRFGTAGHGRPGPALDPGVLRDRCATGLLSRGVPYFSARRLVVCPDVARRRSGDASSEPPVSRDDRLDAVMPSDRLTHAAGGR